MASAAKKKPETDRAIVIGIGNYRRYGPQLTANDLSGPVADASEIADWLVKEAKAKVTLITSNGIRGRKWRISNMRPQVDDMEEPLNELAVESLTRVAEGKPSRIARRLYIYVAGHGFMPEADHVALVAADSIDRNYVRSIEMTAWAYWFAEQYHFDELVLWMDCCADRNFYQKASGPLLERSAPRSGRAKMFVAYAAKPNQAAYEGPVGPNGEIRGIFTAKLLAALKGAKPDSQGRINSQSLKSYLEASGLAGGTESEVKAEHKVAQADPMLFGRVKIDTPFYDVLLPLADGTEVLVTDGSHNEITTETVADGRIAVALIPGLYKVAAAGKFNDVFEVPTEDGFRVDLR